MNLDVLAAALADADLGVVGETIFQEHMPSGVDEGILLKIPLGGTPMDHELPGYYRGQLQVIVRSTSHETGESLSRQVMDLLTTQETRDYTDEDDEFAMRVNLMLPDTLPLRFPRSDGGYIEWSINFDCSFVLPA